MKKLACFVSLFICLQAFSQDTLVNISLALRTVKRSGDVIVSITKISGTQHGLASIGRFVSGQFVSRESRVITNDKMQILHFYDVLQGETVMCQLNGIQVTQVYFFLREPYIKTTQL